MNRSSGIGLMVLGVVLLVVGAIMRFAVSAKTSGFDIHKTGVILLMVGIGVFVVSLLILAVGGRSRSTTADGCPGNSLRPRADRAAGRLQHVLTTGEVCGGSSKRSPRHYPLFLPPGEIAPAMYTPTCILFRRVQSERNDRALGG
jgi:hypothetical protein